MSRWRWVSSLLAGIRAGVDRKETGCPSKYEASTLRSTADKKGGGKGNAEKSINRTKTTKLITVRCTKKILCTLLQPGHLLVSGDKPGAGHAFKTCGQRVTSLEGHMDISIRTGHRTGCDNGCTKYSTSCIRCHIGSTSSRLVFDNCAA